MSVAILQEISTAIAPSLHRLTGIPLGASQAYAGFDGNSPPLIGSFSASARSPRSLPATPPSRGPRALPAVSPEIKLAVRSSMAELEAKLEGVLENVTEDFAAEVGREQQHLMLMQASPEP